MIGRGLALLGMILLAGISYQSSQALVIDFDDLKAGAIVSDQYQNVGVTVSAKNAAGGPDIAIVFDSQNPTGADYDLAAPWSGGNIKQDTLDKVLILAENDIDLDANGLIDSPDDEGARPAGSIYFDFDDTMCEVGFDLIDVEGPSEYSSDSGYVATFFMDGTELARVGFDKFIDKDSTLYDNTIDYGNSKANRISPITVEQLESFTQKTISGFDRVEFNFGGSAAIDNLDVTQCSHDASVQYTEKTALILSDQKQHFITNDDIISDFPILLNTLLDIRLF